MRESRRPGGGHVPALTATLLAGLLATPVTAWAWASPEHQEIGEASYRRACEMLAATLATTAGTPDSEVKTRWELACGRNVDVLAQLYGQATSLAADFLGAPEEFTSAQGSWRFRSNKSYYLLALENGSHFHPMSVRAWRDHHQTAITQALAAARAQGLASIAGFESALHESAFADHFLQDSFCSGHMGFNRVATSAAASKAFHDAWNVRGRLVSSRTGRRWITYGDLHLNDKANQDGRRHVMDAATLSIHGVLRTFVLQQRSAQEEMAIWQALPFTIEAPDLPVAIAEPFVDEANQANQDRRLWPLLGIMHPARKDLVAHARVWSASPFEDPGDVTVAAVAGLELALPYVPAQSHLGAGATLREPDGGHTAVLEAGVLVPIGLSIDGLLSHELSAIASVLVRSDPTAILHFEYQLSAELGTFLLTLHVGLSEFLPDARTGWYAGLGIGTTFTAAGGGAF